MAIVEGIIGLARVFGRGESSGRCQKHPCMHNAWWHWAAWVQGTACRPMPAASVLPWIEQWRSQAGDAVTAA